MSFDPEAHTVSKPMGVFAVKGGKPELLQPIPTGAGAADGEAGVGSIGSLIRQGRQSDATNPSNRRSFVYGRGAGDEDVAHVVIDAQLVAQLLVSGIVLGSRYALIAVSFGIIYSTTQIFHLAHAGTYTIAAYAAIVVANMLGAPSGWHCWSGLPAAVLFGAVMELGMYRPMRRRQPPSWRCSSPRSASRSSSQVPCRLSSDRRT